jgi:hypothetical protein
MGSGTGTEASGLPGSAFMLRVRFFLLSPPFVYVGRTMEIVFYRLGARAACRTDRTVCLGDMLGRSVRYFVKRDASCAQLRYTAFKLLRRRWLSGSRIKKFPDGVVSFSAGIERPS